jgi:hypothetical protein
MLEFNGRWRFQPPADGTLRNRSIPNEAVWAFVEQISRAATQGPRQEILEHFKGYFCTASGSTHVWSSSESWAETDLQREMAHASENAPLFIEAFYDACTAFRSRGERFFAPDAAMINELCSRFGIGYEVRPPELILRETATPIVPVPERPPTLSERAITIMEESLRRSEQLLADAHSREAVQESLWLLESVTTAFRGLAVEGETVRGGYFNQIVRDLRRASRGSNLERVLEWITTLHGYLSSPTGGGIRHGLDLNEGIAVEASDARLFCNLVRSYLSYLLVEHERLSQGP